MLKCESFQYLWWTWPTFKLSDWGTFLLLTLLNYTRPLALLSWTGNIEHLVSAHLAFLRRNVLIIKSNLDWICLTELFLTGRTIMAIMLVNLAIMTRQLYWTLPCIETTALLHHLALSHLSGQTKHLLSSRLSRASFHKINLTHRTEQNRAATEGQRTI